MNWPVIGYSILLVLCVVLMVVLVGILVLTVSAIVESWLDHEPRRLRVAERRIRRLGDLARLDAARIERGEEAILVEAEAKRHQKHDAREDAFRRRLNPE